MPNSDLVLEVYSSGTTRIIDQGLDYAQGLTFDTIYPGGLYAAAGFFVPRIVAQNWLVQGAQRVVFRYGQAIAYEGYIANLQSAVSGNGQGVQLLAVGAWGAKVETRRWRKRWADKRISDDIWVFDETATGALKCDFDRSNRLFFKPTNDAWGAGQYAAVRYTMPTGETCKRITFNYDFSELALVSPSVIFHFVSPATYTKLTNAFDGDNTTSVNATIVSGDYLYVGMHAGDTDTVPAGATAILKFQLTATVNTNTADIAAEYWNGSVWTSVAGLSDGTFAGGKTLAQSGNITFTRPGDWGAVAIEDADNTVKMWVRLSVNADLSAVGFKEIEFGSTQDWSALLWNVTGAAAEWTQSSTGTGSQDITFGTPTQSLEFRLKSNVAQLPNGNGTIYAKITSVVVYGETGSINLTEVVKDCGGAAGGRLNGVLSTSEYLIGSNTYSLATNGFIADNWGETLGAIMVRAARFGDSSFNRWAVGVRASSLAPDGLPIMFAEAYPNPATDYDYSISLADTDPSISISLDYDQIYNWIVVRYTNENGNDAYITPDDDANLKDTASIAAYGQRDYTFDASFTGVTNATNLGRKWLAASKYPKYHMSGPIVAREPLKTRYGGREPLALVTAGKRLRIDDYFRDVNGVSGSQLTFLISQTTYTDSPPTLTMTAGVKDDLAVLLAQLMGG